jgi:hypothetical protein
MTETFPLRSGHKAGLLQVRGERENAVRDIYIESYGVKICFSVNNRDALEAVERILPVALPGDCYRLIEKTEVGHHFELILDPSRDDEGCNLFRNGRQVPNDHSRLDVLRGFESQIRLTVAEHAVGKVFVHAGAVVWKGKAIIIPGNSFTGKTTLTAALVGQGAEYLSDEYAVFDEAGDVHPFLKTLSVRGIVDEFTQKEIPVEDFGGRPARGKYPIGLVLITEFQAGAHWRPQRLSPGLGVLEMLPNVVPVRYDPEFTLKVLNRVAKRAIITKTFRDDAAKCAESVLDYFESVCLKN